MRVLFDTSVLVAAMIEAHPAHKRGFPWLRKAVEGEDDGFVTLHTIAELYTILTALPVSPSITPSLAERLIQHNVVDKLKIVPLTEQDYLEIVDRLVKSGLGGGIIYDALIIKAAEKIGVDKVLSFNVRDFQRVSPEFAEKVVSP